jgi:hypothetical protein
MVDDVIGRGGVPGSALEVRRVVFGITSPYEEG